MFDLCQHAKEGTGESWQREKCCGSGVDDCSVSACHLQDSWAWFTDEVWDTNVRYTFAATGCPNPKPNTTWWKTQMDDVIWSSMWTTCMIVHENDTEAWENDTEAFNWYKEQCCGGAARCAETCTEMFAWSWFTDEVFNDTAIHTFSLTGCPNRAPNISWWMTQPQHTVWEDMYDLCQAAGQECCGSQACTPTCTRQYKWSTES
eukprot:TRINITY_DN55023_c0_g1_i1.p1 TRINITY_DN55023_c0_g1~~TRINITY_DN55023_c0_g1_i1.p1  ORF type:complete len:204 (-),score=35.56 TRINITY_DN55023_c0_g1_i1:99-710(-)